ncbi:flagellar hook assembly protein FlgD [Candidatus Latescibacterota bacterium]
MISTTTIPTNISSSAGLLDSKSNMDISTLGKDDFLTLLIAQLRNQDPLNPASNTEFIAQLAQFSSLEQMTLMNGNLEKSLSSNVGIAESISNAMIINYFGKSITAESEYFAYDGGDSAELQFDLERPAAYGTIEITDESGNILTSAALGAMEDGPRFIYEWDGMTTYGVKAKEGIYKYNIKAFDAFDNEINVTQLSSGIVKGISYQDGVTSLNMSGILVPFDKVINITESE